MNIEKIKPCPFCGCKPKLIEGWGAPAGVGTAWSVTITCESKRCKINPQLSTNTIFYRSDAKKELKTETIKAWNKRKN